MQKLLPISTSAQLLRLLSGSTQSQQTQSSGAETPQTSPLFGPTCVPQSITGRSTTRARRLSSFARNGSPNQTETKHVLPLTTLSPAISEPSSDEFLSPANSESGCLHVGSPPSATAVMPAEAAAAHGSPAQSTGASYVESDGSPGHDRLSSPSPLPASDYIKRLSDEFARTLMAGMSDDESSSDGSDEEHCHVERPENEACLDAPCTPQQPVEHIERSDTGLDGTPATVPASPRTPPAQALDDSCSSVGSDEVIIQPRVLTTARKAAPPVSRNSPDDSIASSPSSTPLPRRRLVPKTPAGTAPSHSSALNRSDSSSVRSTGSTPCSISLTAVKAGLAAAGYADDADDLGRGYDFRRDSLGVDCYEEDGWLVSDAGVPEGGSCCSGDDTGLQGGLLDASWSSSGSDSSTLSPAVGAGGGSGGMTDLYGAVYDPQLDAVFAGGSSKRGKAQREGCVAQVYPEFNRVAFDNALPTDLEITWSNTLRKTAGLTYTRRVSGGRKARVELSSKVCDTRNRTAATLLHELCHVAAWLVDGVHKPPHGRVFKMWAARVSAVYPHFEVTTTHSYSIRYKHTYECMTCKTTYGRHSKSIDVETQRCGACEGILRLRAPDKAAGEPRLADLPMQCDSPSKCDEPDWLVSAAGTPGATPLRIMKSDRSNAPPSSAKRPPSAFAQFVKDHYSTVRSEAGTVATHADVMATLSLNWKAFKENSS